MASPPHPQSLRRLGPASVIRSSVRRIFEKGGPGNSENSRLMKTRMKIFQPKTKSVFPCPKVGEDQKKRSSLKFSTMFGQKRSSRTVSVLKPSPQITKRGPRYNSAYFSMLIILSWRPKGGGHGPMAPPKYAPGDTFESQ